VGSWENGRGRRREKRSVERGRRDTSVKKFREEKKEKTVRANLRKTGPPRGKKNTVQETAPGGGEKLKKKKKKIWKGRPHRPSATKNNGVAQ